MSCISDVSTLSCGLRPCWPPLDLRVLHSYNVMAHQVNVSTARDSCTKAEKDKQDAPSGLAYVMCEEYDENSNP